ncbi:MAG: arylesterase [Rhizobiaceae bacterium]
MAFKRFVVAVVAVLVSALAAPAAESYRIVGFGDSLMAGYGLGPGEAVPEKLESLLRAKGHDVVIANAGVSGDTTSGGLSRLDWSIPDGTDLVILELGANDMLRGITPDITRNNLDAMIARLKERGIDVLLAGMLAAPNLGADYADAFNLIYPTLAKKHGVAFYAFFMDGVAAEPSLLLDDGMHPNSAGVDRIVEGVAPMVERFIIAKAQAG